MSRTNQPLYTFNKGEIGRHALGRMDVDQLQLAAEEQTNFIPMTLGPMQFRPGLEYIGETLDSGQAVLRPFIFATDDTALLELTDETLRIWVDDELLAANSVSTTISNGDMGSSTDWTLTSTLGGTASIAGGKLLLVSKPLGGSAEASHAVTISAIDSNTVHRLRIVVDRGPVVFSIADSGLTNDNLFKKTSLGTGTHSIAFDPDGNTTIYVIFHSDGPVARIVDSITVESAGPVELPTPWLTADLATISREQSGDIIFCAQSGHQPRQIERRDNNSWSVVLHEQIGGPYRDAPEWAARISMETDTEDGTGTMISSAAFFSEDDENSIIAVDRAGTYFEQILGDDGQYTMPFLVSGTDSNDRTFSVTRSGTWVGTIALYRSSVGPDDGFVAAPDTFTSVVGNGTTSIADYTTHANRNVWYRFGFSAHTSGTATILVDYRGGITTRGQGRIRVCNSSTEVTIETIDTFQNRINDYDPGTFRVADWSDRYGWPSSVVIHDGRLWWGGRDKLWGSISDDYPNHEETFEGDAGPINRSFGYGPFSRVNWLCSLNRLIAGRDSSCVSVRSSNFDAPLTPTDFTMRDSTTIGTAALPPAKIDKSAVFVDKSGRRVYELRYDVDAQDYFAHDLTTLNPDIGEEGFADIAIQRQLDTRVHLVRGDGRVAVLSYERGKLESWWQIETDGEVESVCVLPGDLEDKVYYVVKRTIDGSPVRYIEKLARQDEAIGAAINKMADSFLLVSQASSTTISGLTHLEGEEVVVWAGGVDLGSYTVSGGAITVSEAVTSAVVGLSYEGRFRSAKLAFAAQQTALMQKKRAVQLGLLMMDTHYQGLEIGQDFTTMDQLPLIEDGTETPEDTIWTEFDAPMIPIPGAWFTDARLCLRATAPRPVTVAAAVIAVQTHEKT